MEEHLYYLELNNKIHFINEHQPDEIKGEPFIFFNPIFDEKKRSQKFYAETARTFCNKGIPVIRFDYYGTDDSYGQLYEMDLGSIKEAAKNLINKVIKKYKCTKINLLGLRMGADIAMQLTQYHPNNINFIFLIEPIIIGKRFLLEQRTRRKFFYKINNMTNIKEEIYINEKLYEDHQGYLISVENQFFLNQLNSNNISFSGKNIALIKLNTFSSRKIMNQLKEKLMEKNSVLYYYFEYPDFWSTLEPTNTQPLSNNIANEILNL